MVQVIQPRVQIVKVVPRDGELEVTVNVNITIDGQITTSQAEKQIEKKAVSQTKEEETKPLIPDFTSGPKLNFAKQNS